MPYSLRPMEERDLQQAMEVERDAFPEVWPSTPLRKELSNRFAGYLVAYHGGDLEDLPNLPIQTRTRVGLLGNMIRRMRGVRSTNDKESSSGPQDFIAGWVGVWFIMEDAHITSIGVRGAYRSRGIGELLLIGAIELTRKSSCKRVTLEVRASNQVAQSLYRKYGFNEVGLRKGYYTDNNEDALIMTTDPIETPEFSAKFQSLVQAHQERWGASSRAVG